MTTSPPRDPRAERQTILIIYLRAALILLIALAASAVTAEVLPGSEAADVAELLGKILVGVLVGALVIRVGWLLVRWIRCGDKKFAAAAAGLLVVLVLAAIIPY